MLESTQTQVGAYPYSLDALPTYAASHEYYIGSHTSYARQVGLRGVRFEPRKTTII